MASSSPAAPSSSLSFSSSLSLSSDNHHRHLHRHDRIHYRIFSPRFPFRCAITSSSYSSVATPKKEDMAARRVPGDVNSSSDTKKRRTPIKNIKKKLDRKDNLNPWVKTVTEELSDSINTKQWLRALEVFEMLKQQPFYQPKEGTYMKLIVLLGRSGQPQHARNMFNAMIEEGLEPTAELYTALLAAYCRSNLIDEAFKILDQMKTLPFCQPDHPHQACVDAARFDLVESLYEQMAERSITPNTVTQNTCLSDAEQQSAKPDVWTMNTILSLFGNTGHIETMEKWYEKFGTSGLTGNTNFQRLNRRLREEKDVR
ncbi:hypothetical protein OSB04_029859 [Centaurea solstitialis]|uniref:Pentatricopeptide repeat-containing protein n=1 Tax=Centaurea solstitialis TaxID=347529 RepID=A0AA38W6K3_9ASTR|nr:hypothetical protein OSB04_029859 [Centaurea solstitialis]